MGNLGSAYASLVRHKNRIMAQRLWYVVLEQFLMKYVWSGTGMVMISLPIIMSSLHSNGQSIIFSFSTTVYPQCFTSDLTNAIHNTVQIFHYCSNFYYNLGVEVKKGIDGTPIRLAMVVNI